MLKQQMFKVGDLVVPTSNAYYIVWKYISHHNRIQLAEVVEVFNDATININIVLPFSRRNELINLHATYFQPLVSNV